MKPLPKTIHKPKLYQRFICPFCSKIVSIKKSKNDLLPGSDIDIECKFCRSTFAYCVRGTEKDDSYPIYTTPYPYKDRDCDLFATIYPYKDNWIMSEYIGLFSPSTSITDINENTGFKSMFNSTLPFPISQQQLNDKFDKLILLI